MSSLFKMESKCIFQWTRGFVLPSPDLMWLAIGTFTSNRIQSAWPRRSQSSVSVTVKKRMQNIFWSVWRVLHIIEESTKSWQLFVPFTENEPASVWFCSLFFLPMSSLGPDGDSPPSGSSAHSCLDMCSSRITQYDLSSQYTFQRRWHSQSATLTRRSPSYTSCILTFLSGKRSSKNMEAVLFEAVGR